MDLVNIFIARDKCHQTCSFHEASQHFPLHIFKFPTNIAGERIGGPISDFGTYFVNLSSKVGGSYCGPCNILRVVCLEYKIWCKAHTHQAVHITYFKMTTKSDDIWFSLYDIFTLWNRMQIKLQFRGHGILSEHPAKYSVQCTLHCKVKHIL